MLVVQQSFHCHHNFSHRNSSTKLYGYRPLPKFHTVACIQQFLVVREHEIRLNENLFVTVGTTYIILLTYLYYFGQDHLFNINKSQYTPHCHFPRLFSPLQSLRSMQLDTLTTLLALSLSSFLSVKTYQNMIKKDILLCADHTRSYFIWLFYFLASIHLTLGSAHTKTRREAARTGCSASSLASSSIKKCAHRRVASPCELTLKLSGICIRTKSNELHHSKNVEIIRNPWLPTG